MSNPFVRSLTSLIFPESDVSGIESISHDDSIDYLIEMESNDSIILSVENANRTIKVLRL